MKVLYFGTVCSVEHYSRLLATSKYRPSMAPIVFESALLSGFKENGVAVDIHSYPMVPSFPTTKCLYFGGTTEELSCGYRCRWLKTINIPVLKQLSRRNDARKILHRWTKDHGEDGVILTYSIPPFLVKDILRYAKRNNIKTVAIVTDLLRNMYINQKATVPFSKLKQQYLKSALKLQDEYDGYVYLTEAMHREVAPEKPYIVIESIADVSVHKQEQDTQKAPCAIMYAGRLHEKYGLINLLDAFETMSCGNTELWLFGEGTAVPEIRRRAEKNAQIKYFGSMARDEILAYERRATLLVNPRDPKEEFTGYSFPSKMIEYMLSGTPVLTARLPGIPEEYFQHVFWTERNDAVTLASAMESVLSQSAEERTAFGLAAREFIVKEKNAATQVGKIVAFLSEV